MAPTTLIGPYGSITPLACDVLHALTGVPMELLNQAHIKPTNENWLHAPWYTYGRGGAITIGQDIYFTRRYFDANGDGDGSLRATWAWLRLLAHEVGHLTHAERFGYSPWGRTKYIAAFTWQYTSRALTFRFPVHDGSSMEKEADMGRWVLMQAVGDEPLTHPLVLALYAGDAQAAQVWLAANGEQLLALRQRYQLEFLH